MNDYGILKCNHSSISIRLDNGRQRTPSQLVPGKNGGIIEERTRAQSRAGNALNAEDQYQVSYTIKVVSSIYRACESTHCAQCVGLASKFANIICQP